MELVKVEVDSNSTISCGSFFAPKNDEYERDGILYCKMCNTPRTLEFMGRKVRCNCQCQEEKYNRKQQEEKRKEQLLLFTEYQKSSLMGTRYKNASFDKVDIDFSAGLRKAFDRCKKYCEVDNEVLKKGYGIYIFGSKGVGKTYLTACMANALMEKLHSVLFTNFFEIASKIKATFNNPKISESDITNELANIEFLFIDDLGTERISSNNGTDSWLQEKVFDILNKRYNNCRPTIFTSNYSLNELCSERGLAEKTVDRIMEMSTVCLKIESESYRKKMRRRDDIPF